MVTILHHKYAFEVIIMKKIIIILFLLSIINIVNAADKKPFIWADDENYWPAIYKGENNNPKGIFNDIMTEIFKRLDIPLKKAVYPWKRAQIMVKNGKADGMVTVLTKERKIYTVGTEPLWYISEKLFFRSDNPKVNEILKIKSFEDMKKFKIVDTIGSGWIKDKFEEHGLNDNVVWVQTTESAFNMLAKGRVDIYIMFDLNAFKIIKERAKSGPLKNDYKKIITSSPRFASLPFRLLIRKTSPFVKKIDDINKIIEEMKKDGTYQRIKNKYMNLVNPL